MDLVTCRAHLGQFLAEHDQTVVFTGAGVSTESGIPDFRSPGGVWTRYDPRQMTFDRYVASADVRAMSWQMRREFFAVGARPNGAHTAIARLEAAGRSPGVITQNIDGLHAAGGTVAIAELHGTAREVGCIGLSPVGGRPDGCGFRVDTQWAFQQLDGGITDPRCPDCGGLIKSATVSFGQAMDEVSLDRAEQLIAQADAMLVVGSSLEVYPAASLPEVAVRAGMGLAILNRDPTPFDHLADVVIHASAAEVLPAAVDMALSGP